jgi:hypothetical protein
MTQIQIDATLQQQLNGVTDHIAFCDSNGQVLGHFLPEPEYMRMLYASVKPSISEEEIERRRAEKGGFTLQQIWKELGQE